jgi:hypothetical protein
LAPLPIAARNTFRADLRIVDEKIRLGVTSKRAKAADAHWGRWETFCLANNIDPFMRNIEDPVPILQVFAQRYRDGRIAPRKNAVRSDTVSDAIRAVGQTFSRLGAKDIRKDAYGEIDFRIYRQFRAYTKEDSPSTRVKPVPIIIIIYILHQAFGATPLPDRQAVADMCTIAFYFLLRPGEYTGTTSDDSPFRLADVALHIGSRRLDTMLSSTDDIQAADSVSYTFTTQKNGTKGEILTHGLSGDEFACPVKATIRRIIHLRHNKAPSSAPIASYYHGNKRVPLKSKDITEALRLAAVATTHQTGLLAADISARSLRAGGAMALLNGKIDHNTIRMLGRWHSDAMMRYLHLQSRPIMCAFASTMFNHGTYDFLPEETVPLNDY